jgi:hypothetical protein
MIGDFVQAFTFGAKFKFFVMDAHNRWNIESCRDVVSVPLEEREASCFPQQSAGKRARVDLYVR